MRHVHPKDRLRPWFGVAVGLASLAGMLAFGILGRNFGTLDHLKLLNDAGGWLALSLIEASAGILALLLAAVSFEVLKVAATTLVGEGWLVSTLAVAQIVFLAAAVGAFAFMLSSLWATLKLTFVGVPESAPEEDEAQESGPVE
jgi:hypothetical protein